MHGSLFYYPIPSTIRRSIAYASQFPTRYTASAQKYATAVWNTNSADANLRLVSRRTAAIAATQGGYSSTNTQNAAAACGDANSAATAVPPSAPGQHGQRAEHGLLRRQAGEQRGGQPPVAPAERREQHRKRAADVRQHAVRRRHSQPKPEIKALQKPHGERGEPG